MIYEDAFISIAGTDLSAYCESVEPNFDVEMTDDTVMGDTARSNEPGLEDWSFSCAFKDPFAASGPDATIYPQIGSTFTIIWRPDSAAAAATNPQYSGTGVIRNYKPVGQKVGEQAVATVEIVAAGALTRATS